MAERPSDDGSLAARHLMTSPVVSVRAGAPLAEAVSLIRDRQIHRVLVTVPESGRERPIRILSATDAGLRRLMEGSVAERIARAAPVPVLLVEHGERQAWKGASALAASPAGGHEVRRRFWCGWSGRDVEVGFVERGLPGIPWAVAVRSCSAFDPPTAIGCRRQCLDAAFRRQWAHALPVYGHWT